MALELAFNRKGIPIYPWYISDMVATKNFAKVSGGLAISKVFFFQEKGMSYIYYDRGSTEAIGQRLLEKINQDRNFYQAVANKIYNHSTQLLDFCETLKKINPARLSHRQLLNLYVAYEKKLGDLRTWGWVPPVLDGIFQPFLSDLIMSDLKKFLIQKNQVDQVANFYSLLSSSEKKSEVQTETLARLKLIIKIKASRNGEAAIKNIQRKMVVNFSIKFPEAYKLINNHIKHFGWLTYAYAGPAMDFNYLIDMLASDLRTGDIKAQIEDINNHFRTVKKEKAALSSKLGLLAKLSYLFKVSSELMFIKDYRKGVYQKSYLAMDKIMTEAANRLGLNLSEIKFLILPEIRDALLNNKINKYRAIAKQRVNKCGYVIAKGKIRLFEGREADKLITKVKQQLKPKDQITVRSKELKGSIAYAGLVRGIVKIVLTKEDIPKFKAGNILVSSATNPDLISAMKKAAAFVTDTGGIICHAAIVARELKKPCVIGTKIATSVLKDGDFVEVDANHGLVRILKK